MAINILGKFLTNRDNNIRSVRANILQFRGLSQSYSYVALQTLNQVVAMDTNAVQRHRNTILECLRDGDISIRRRALELSYALINEQNVRVLIRELLAFLELADDEFKLSMTTQISLAAERFAPNKRWHIDTVLRVLRLVRGILLCLCHSKPLAGWQLCTGGGFLGVHSPGSTYARTTRIHRVQTIQRFVGRYLPRVSNYRYHMGPWGVQRYFDPDWYNRRRSSETGLLTA